MNNSEVKNYLLERLSFTPLVFFILIILIYDSNANNNYIFYGTSAFLMILLVLVLLRTYRILIHLFIINWLIIAIFQTVFFTSNKSQDFVADRDDAAEIATQALLAGENPWGKSSSIGNPITTGPISILIAIPSIIITKKINSTAFLFWVLFLLVLMVGDYSLKNNSFLLLSPLLLLPILGFQHTMFYSLEELYYGLLFLPLLIMLLSRFRFFLAGVVLSAILLNRASYIFLYRQNYVVNKWGGR